MEEQKDPTNIFPYHNGTMKVYGDPLNLYRRLMEQTGGDLNGLIEAFNSPDPAAHLVATGKLVEAVRTSFNMVPFNHKDGSGATETLCLEVLRLFVSYKESKKNNTESSPT